MTIPVDPQSWDAALAPEPPEWFTLEQRLRQAEKHIIHLDDRIRHLERVLENQGLVVLQTPGPTFTVPPGYGHGV